MSPIFTDDYRPGMNVRGSGPGVTTVSSRRPISSAGPRVAPPAADAAQSIFGDIFNIGRDIITDLIPGTLDDALFDLIPGGSSCPTGFSRVNGSCVPNPPTTTGAVPGTGPMGDPTPGINTPAERSVGATGLAAPSATAVTVHKCPRYADGKTGILYIHPFTGQLVCFPRGVNGKKFGFVRKNKPRPKPPMTAAEAKTLKRVKTLERKARQLASAAGFTCKAKSTRG